MEHAPAETPERRAFYDRIDTKNLTPLWAVMASMITPEPRSGCVPAVWSYRDVREALMEAGGLITAKEAERRVLILENPGLRGQSRITTSLYAGIQLVLPGEVAPAHRHTQSALRFVLEGEGAHTAVDGEKTIMRYGDFVITPQMAWHDHGNETDDAMLWLDGLDIPLVSMLDASFAEPLAQDEQPITRATGHSYAAYGHNLMPIDASRRSVVSPVFNYPYEHARGALETLKRDAPLDPCHGLKMRYTNPLNGDWAMPTIGTCLQLLPAGFTTSTYRATDATIFTCVEGEGETRVGADVLRWGPRDIFVVPSWQPVVHAATSETVLFSYSDRPVQEKLGLHREDRGNA
ncbi:MAG: gentisate 1,2-dioxygenase [Pseudomonadota bacterium]